MGTSHTCHPLARITTALKACLSNVLSTTLPYSTILGSLTALTLEKSLKNIHAYKHDLLFLFISLAWLRLRAFGAQPASESSIIQWSASYFFDALHPWDVTFFLHPTLNWKRIWPHCYHQLNAIPISSKPASCNGQCDINVTRNGLHCNITWPLT